MELVKNPNNKFTNNKQIPTRGARAARDRNSKSQTCFGKFYLVSKNKQYWLMGQEHDAARLPSWSGALAPKNIEYRNLEMIEAIKSSFFEERALGM